MTTTIQRTTIFSVTDTYTILNYRIKKKKKIFQVTECQ